MRKISLIGGIKLLVIVKSGFPLGQSDKVKVKVDPSKIILFLCFILRLGY